MGQRRIPDQDRPLKTAMLRQVLRVAALLGGLVFLYSGYFWVTRQGGGCAEAQDDDLATIGGLLMVLGVVALGGVGLGRPTAAGMATVTGAMLLFAGIATGLGCLR